MYVFISWSGVRSKMLAKELAEWLPQVLQAVRPYYSPDDVNKGSRWETEIAKSLDASQMGLLCVTPENMGAPWLLFEAGALSKNLGKSKVVPILFGVKPTDLKGPLTQFQWARFEEDEIRRVVSTINDELEEHKRPESALGIAFDKWWPDLRQGVQAALEQSRAQPAPVHRPERELLEEILERVRQTQVTRIPMTSNVAQGLQMLLDQYVTLIRVATVSDVADPLQAVFKNMSGTARYLLDRKSVV